MGVEPPNANSFPRVRIDAVARALAGFFVSVATACHPTLRDRSQEFALCNLKAGKSKDTFGHEKTRSSKFEVKGAI